MTFATVTVDIFDELHPDFDEGQQMLESDWADRFDVEERFPPVEVDVDEDQFVEWYQRQNV